MIQYVERLPAQLKPESLIELYILRDSDVEVHQPSQALVVASTDSLRFEQRLSDDRCGIYDLGVAGHVRNRTELGGISVKGYVAVSIQQEIADTVEVWKHYRRSWKRGRQR